jgi:hypothetical protein
MSILDIDDTRWFTQQRSRKSRQSARQSDGTRCPVGKEAALAASADGAAPAGASFRNAGVLAPPTGYPKK